MADPVLDIELLQDAPRETLLEVIQFLLKKTVLLESRVAELKTRLAANSSNSSKPPSTDSPFTKPAKKSSKPHGRPGGKTGHSGVRYQLLEPTKKHEVLPELCTCGSHEFKGCKPYYTHQHLELPEVKLDITHFTLFQGVCACCGKTGKGRIPDPYSTGYGPRLSATIAELAGSHGDSRLTIQSFCTSVLGFSISLGTIQKILDRTSEAITPHYEEIGTVARQAEINHVDETSWRLKGALYWLWVLTNNTVALFMIHQKRSKDAFRELVR